jgi:hypothetical protein
MTPIEKGGWEETEKTKWLEMYERIGDKMDANFIADYWLDVLAEKDRLLLEGVEGMRTVGAHLHDEGYNAAVDDFKRLIRGE